MISETAAGEETLVRYHVIHAPTGRRLMLHVTREGKKSPRFALRDGTRLKRLGRWIYEDADGARYGAVSDKAPERRGPRRDERH